MNIIFDENLSEYSVGHLRSFFQSHKSPRPIFSHVREFGAGSEPDDIWIPRMIPQKSIIISGDLGRQVPRLPEICKQNNKTHILFSPTLQQASNFVKLRAIIVLWPKICEAWDGKQGARYMIRAIKDINNFGWIRKL